MVNQETSLHMLTPTEPYARGLRAVLALLVLALAGLIAGAMVTMAKPDARLAVLLSGVAAVVLSIVLVVILGARALQRRQLRAFVASKRSRVRWAYTPQEAARIRAARWDEERADWRLQLFCLTGFAGMVGALVGLIGYLSGALDPLVPIGVGLGLGAVVGGAVAAANYAGARAERAASGPMDVVLGIDAFAVDGSYFQERGAEHVIEAIHLEEGGSPRLIIETWSHPWYQRAPLERVWHIPVPPGQIDAVRDFVEAVRRRL